MTKHREEVTPPASCGDFSLKQTASYFNRRLIEIMYGFYPTSLLICIMLCSWNNRGNAHMFTWLMWTFQTSGYCWSCIHKGTLGQKEVEPFLVSLSHGPSQRLRGTFDGEQCFSNCTVFKYSFLHRKTVFCLFFYRLERFSGAPYNTKAVEIFISQWQSRETCKGWEEALRIAGLSSAPSHKNAITRG